MDNTHKSNRSSRHELFVLGWSSLFSSLLLCTTTRVYILREIQSRNFQSIKLTKIPRTKLNWLVKKGSKQILFAKADSLVDRIFSFPRIKLSKSQTLILDGVQTGSLLSGFAQQLRRKNTDVPDIDFTLLGAADSSPTLVLNQNAKANERLAWVPFKIIASQAAKSVHEGRCCLWACSHFCEN